MKAVSVNPVDTKVRTPRRAGRRRYKVLGYDAAGVVDAVGPEVTLFKPGDEVFYAGSILRPAPTREFHLVDERIVGRKPNTLGFAQAAALPLTAITAWELLFDRLTVQPGKSHDPRTLLIIGGAGGVGSILIQLARRLTGAQRGRHGVAAADHAMVPRARRACGDRSRQTAEAADRGAEAAAGGADRQPHRAPSSIFRRWSICWRRRASSG